MTPACKKRRGVYISSELGDLDADSEVDESRLSQKDGVTSIPTWEHKSSYKVKAESMNTSKIRLCGNILKNLLDQKGAWLFKQPVDLVLFGIPDYFDVIRNPMDLGTVNTKLSKQQYSSINEFAADVRLTFSNAMKYNPPGNDVHSVAEELNGIFNSEWESMERKIRAQNPVQEQKTMKVIEVQATMDSKSTAGCLNSIPSVVRGRVAWSNSIAKKALPDALGRLSQKDGVTSSPTCENQSSYKIKAENLNASKISLCGNILRKLMDHKGAWLFKQPVDPVLFGIPEYFDIIHNPMDLGTIKTKLSKNQYTSIEEFAADVRLTFSNAMKYNPPGNDVHSVAEELNRIFDSEWESRERKFRGQNPVQEQQTMKITEVQATMDSKSSVGCLNSIPSVVRGPVACSNSIAEKALPDALSRLSQKDGVTSSPTCENQSSYMIKAKSLNTSKISLCRNILRKLMDHKGAWLFKEPVDPVLFGIPEYFDIIHNPMDLGTIKTKLSKNQYTSIEEFATDVRLTFSNAMKYNPPGNDVHYVAEELNGIFDSEWESVERKFQGQNPVQEQQTVKVTEVQATMDSKSTAGVLKFKSFGGLIACSNSIAKKALPDALSFRVRSYLLLFTYDYDFLNWWLYDYKVLLSAFCKVKIISFVRSNEQTSCKGLNAITLRNTQHAFIPGVN